MAAALVCASQNGTRTRAKSEFGRGSYFEGQLQGESNLLAGTTQSDLKGASVVTIIDSQVHAYVGVGQ